MESACRLAQVVTIPASRSARSWRLAASVGRDKLTLLLPKRLESFGLWVEQLVAESTGKHGKGVVPIAGESAAHVHSAPIASSSSVRVGDETPDAAVLDRAQGIGRAGRDDSAAGCARARARSSCAGRSRRQPPAC